MNNFHRRLSKVSKPSDHPDAATQVFLLAWMSAGSATVASGIASALLAALLLVTPNLRRASQLNAQSATMTWIAVGIVGISTLLLILRNGPAKWPVGGYWKVHLVALLLGCMAFLAIPIAGLVAYIGVPPIFFGQLYLRPIRGMPWRLTIIVHIGICGLYASSAAQIPPLGGDSRRLYYMHASRGSILVAAIIFGIAMLNGLYWHWYWNVTKSVVETTHNRTVAEPHRIRGAFDELIHNGVVHTLERVAADQLLTADDRVQAGALAGRLRSNLLGDRHPRSMEQLFDAAVAQAGSVNVVLHVLPYVAGEPPRRVVHAVGEALSYLVSNLRHAGVDEANLAAFATANELSLTLRDEGIGFGAASWSKSSTSGRSVSDALTRVGARGEVESSIGKGTTFRIYWNDES